MLLYPNEEAVKLDGAGPLQLCVPIQWHYHRDFKTTECPLDTRWNSKVSDFGIEWPSQELKA